ncbi:hypothetical protein [Planktothrix agardhii]|uniref:hypothetical protein n=1 Tax=Planktothrix agardhii TaxID=1160 RepID=UPI001B94D595|nr:hypothetical protein [Planktothrix agardhii]CAD0218826.1 conserved hypothetical protein [Planktothrix agardhii]CAD5929307.1 hypothetical protein NO758_01172 [Planktothrix agardhii]
MSRLDKDSLLAGNLAQVLAVLQQGLSTGEHQDFVKSRRSHTNDNSNCPQKS